MTAPPSSADFAGLADACARELDDILDWWSQNTVDPRGGFYGEVDACDAPVADAGKGVILNTRMLWFFSAAAQTRQPAAALAKRAYDYLRAYFVDAQHGGVYWALDADGRVIDGKKQAYAQAFAVYALSAYFALTRDAGALTLAREIFALMERHYRDAALGGYVEAFGHAWGPLEDVRLSAHDANCPKTMNTHLHLLEAYAGLHAAAPSPETAEALRGAVNLMLHRFLDRGSRHLDLFFTDDWQNRSAAISFGHDIEASWLIWEACKALGDVRLAAEAEPRIVALARAVLTEGVGADGGVYCERDLASGEIDRSRVWWVQAEAMVGFVNAYELTGDPAFFHAAQRVWDFIRRFQRDTPRGEWTWWSALDTTRPDRSYKAGFWKCPYHNGRAMLELHRRLQRLAAQS